MLVELHMIQNFAPSNLNRDDTGSPKDCEFGGFRRARISSQCLKRAIRTEFKAEDLLPSANLGQRTKRVVDELVARLVARGRPEELARPAVEAMLAGVKLKVEKDGKTQYLLFLSPNEIAALAALCDAYWDTLSTLAPAAAPDEEEATSRGRQSGRRAKQAGQQALPGELVRAVEQALDGGKAADLALFGRMLADLPNKNIDAACQVAHALSTNEVSMEFDFFTAVDDLQPNDTTGAGMLGTVEFNSACFYRYANVDTGQLTQNLEGDADLARQTLEAFLRASITAIPTGKQNSMAAQNPPSFVFAVVRERGPWSLANAFVQPIRPRPTAGLIQQSIHALAAYWDKLAQAYGARGLRSVCTVALDGDGLEHLAQDRADNVEQLIERTCAAAFAGGNEAMGGAA